MLLKRFLDLTAKFNKHIGGGEQSLPPNFDIRRDLDACYLLYMWKEN